MIVKFGALVNHNQDDNRVNLWEFEATGDVIYDRRSSPAAGAQTERQSWNFQVSSEQRGARSEERGRRGGREAKKRSAWTWSSGHGHGHGRRDAERKNGRAYEEVLTGIFVCSYIYSTSFLFFWCR